MLHIEKVSTVSELTRYEDEWRSLVHRSAEASVFDTCEWVTSWLECFWEDKPISFLFVRDEGSLVGVAPLLDDRAGNIRCGLNWNCYWVKVLCASNVATILEALFNHLQKQRPRCRLAFPQVSATGSLVRILPQIAIRHGMHTLLAKAASSPCVRVTGDWESYVRSQSRNTARQVKRKVSRFDSAGHSEWVIVDDVDQLDQATEDLLYIEKNSWKEEAGTSLAAREREARCHFTFALKAAKCGWLRLYLLYLDSRPIAHILGVVLRNHYYSLKTSYHSAYRHLAPGIVLFDYALRDAFARGLETFHFLGVEARWKQEFSNDMDTYFTVCAFPRGSPRCTWCEIYRRHLQPFIKTRLPFLIAAKKKAAAIFGNER